MQEYKEHSIAELNQGTALPSDHPLERTAATTFLGTGPLGSGFLGFGHGGQSSRTQTSVQQLS